MGFGLDNSINAALIGAAGGVAVWLLNWSWTLWSEHRQRVKIRTMLSIEIDGNLSDLRSFEAEAQRRVTFTNAKHLGVIQKLDALAQLPLPRPRHAMWQALVASVPTTLNADEIQKVFRLHDDLDEIADLKASATPSSAGNLKKQVESKCAAVLQAGNPIGRKAS